MLILGQNRTTGSYFRNEEAAFHYENPMGNQVFIPEIVYLRIVYDRFTLFLYVSRINYRNC